MGEGEGEVTEADLNKCLKITKASRWNRLNWFINRIRFSQTIDNLKKEIKPLRQAVNNQIALEADNPKLVAAYRLISNHLEGALIALDRGEVELAAAYYHKANRYFEGLKKTDFESIFDKDAKKIDEGYIAKKAEAIEAEGKCNLTPVGRELMDAWLKTDEDHDVTIIDVVEAQRILDLKKEDDIEKSIAVQTQLITLSLISVFLVGSIIILLSTDVINTDLDNYGSWICITLFGALGGVISGVYSFQKVSFRNDIDTPTWLMNGWLTVLKPIVGAAAAVVIIIFVKSGIADLGEISTYQLLAVAFVSGFTERLVNGSVEKVSIK